MEMITSAAKASDAAKENYREELEKQIEDEALEAWQISEELITAYKGIYNRLVKRILDFILALILLIVTSPLLLIIALIIVFDTGLPVFYRAERGGYRQKSFRIFKFRTMVNNADKIGGGTTAFHDSRITKAGAFLRKTKLDEFANLISIITGNMSFIGPRPELLEYTKQYKGAELLIHEVRPGITDYSSIEFINLDEIVGDRNADEVYEKYVLPKKNKLRIKYAATVSFKTDCKLFFLTVAKVLQKGTKTIFESCRGV